VQDASFLIIGERVNASGSKKMRDLLNSADWDGLVALGKEQEREGAHILDVNVDFVGRDGEADMHELASRLVTNVKIPLMFDSTEWQKMEAGLQHAGGKSILNSTNYEDGVPRFLKVINLAKRYGASVVIGTIDEEGMARTADGKFKIAKRAYEQATLNAACRRLTSSSIRWRCPFRPASKKIVATRSKRSKRSSESSVNCRARSRCSACRTSRLD
jgi:5-methyltetrahydrofolate--homocysteine methyltransferase